MGVVKYIKVGAVKNKYNIKNTAVVGSRWVGNEWVGRVEGKVTVASDCVRLRCQNISNFKMLTKFDMHYNKTRNALNNRSWLGIRLIKENRNVSAVIIVGKQTTNYTSLII
jgi:hypothetical protein